MFDANAQVWRPPSWVVAVSVPLCLGLAPVATADDSVWDSVNFSFGGFLRTESAFSTVGRGNVNNQISNSFNDKVVARQAYLPPELLPALTGGLLPATTDWGDPGTEFPQALGSDADEPARRGDEIPNRESDWNLNMLRGEFETKIRFGNNWKITARMRAVYDDALGYEEFDASRLTEINDGQGIVGGDPELYQNDVNYFEYRVEGDRNPVPLEYAGENYLIDFPALVLEYANGPLSLRFGNMQIAWGQALFFRVLDVVDGLDLRRHSVLDYAQEEFADERVPALGIRLGYQLTDSILLDSYVKQFRPTVLGNPNTQYNVIPTQFTVHDLYKQGGYDEELNYGFRLRGNLGEFGWQAVYSKRYNPDGVYRWTKSNVVHEIAGGDTGCGTVACSFNLTYNTDPTRTYGSVGEALANTPLEAAPGGVYSAEEWFTYAAQVRLNGVTGLNALITEFDGATDAYASPVENIEQGTAELNTFFIAADDAFRGHIAREYFQEEVFGLGGSYVVSASPGSLLDQLIINLEVSYTPDRTFTNTSLSPREYIVEDAWVGALVMEKYYRFTYRFPATYFVLQWMHRDVDDLFGRHLSGYGGSATSQPDGVDGADYIAFAFQQPFPQDIFRIGFATLYDTRGSILVQPGIRWKPSGPLAVELFYSYIDGCTSACDNPNDTLLSTADWADEGVLRLTYQF